MILYLEIVEMDGEDGGRVVTSKQEFPCDPIWFNRIFMCIQRTNWLETLWFSRQTISATFFRPSSAKFYSSNVQKYPFEQNVQIFVDIHDFSFQSYIEYLVKRLTNDLSARQNDEIV